MFKVEPYLNFEGNCLEAFEFYKSVFGGEFSFVMKFKEAPDMKVDDRDKDRIMHMNLPVGNIVLMGSDVPHDMSLKAGNNVTLSISLDDIGEAKRIFRELSVGGKVTMPLEKTFWAEQFGMFTDKFGINWMINGGSMNSLTK